MNGSESVDGAQRNIWSELCKRHEELKRVWRNRMPERANMRPRPPDSTHQMPDIKLFRCFQFKDSLNSAVIDKDIDRLNIKPLSECKDVYKYNNSLVKLLKVEELHQAIEMRRFDQFNKGLEFDQRSERLFGIYMPGLTNKQPSLVASDFVILQDRARSLDVAMQICSIQGNKINLPEGRSLPYEPMIKRPLNMSFISSGQTFAACHQALSRLFSEERLGRFLFNAKPPVQYKDDDNYWDGGSTDEYDDDDDDDYCWNSTLTAGSTESQKRMNLLNERQRQAVEGILRASCGHRPYILFGPPGTGKTHTLNEAVLQIFDRSCNKVLVCVNSNTCADHLYDKLLQHIPKSDILRMRAGDSVKVVYKAQRVVVTTNTKAFSLLYKTTFKYVFIDEAGHANEAESLIPLCLLQRSGVLVLAGDPKQLGPVVMCQQAAELGLNNTLLDRQFEFDIYKRGSEDNQYNKDYITKLIECYRCDPRVLATSNKLFYENELQCKNKTPQSILDTLKLTSPVQFKQVRGKEQRPHYSTSWCNEEEAITCVNVILRLYKNGFKPEQIGVITPYRLQGSEIFRRLQQENSDFRSNPSAKRFKSEPAQKANSEVRNNWMCKIDTVDAFQGNEREVIIISTVRTSRDESRLDFLNDARRFNVAISRAKWLLIIIGDPDVLTLGSYWPQLINNCACDIDTWANK